MTARENSQGWRAAGLPEGKDSPVLCSYVGETPKEECSTWTLCPEWSRGLEADEFNT